MTYDEIITALKSGKCNETVKALESAVEDEAAVLRDTGKRSQVAREAAREFYASDITTQFRDRVQPTPYLMLSQRRFSVVWAVAEVLLTNNLTGLLQGTGKVRGNKHHPYASAEICAYPHEGGCRGCAENTPPLCNVCGNEKGRNGGSGCTNGRCDTCHRALCTSGGDTSPGHGFGRVS